jgi:hypothetical protein
LSNTHPIDDEPDAVEVLQHEAESPAQIAPVPVDVRGPVRTHELPSPIWSVVSARPTDTVGALQLLSSNPQRKRVTILSAVAGCWIAPTQTQATARAGAFLPVNVPVTVQMLGEVWINNVATESPVVSAIVEYWTE